MNLASDSGEVNPWTYGNSGIAQFTGAGAIPRARAPANLPAAPTLKHPEQEEDEGGVPVTILENAPLDFRA